MSRDITENKEDEVKDEEDITMKDSQQTVWGQGGEIGRSQTSPDLFHSQPQLHVSQHVNPMGGGIFGGKGENTPDETHPVSNPLGAENSWVGELMSGFEEATATSFPSFSLILPVSDPLGSHGHPHPQTTMQLHRTPYALPYPHSCLLL